MGGDISRKSQKRGAAAERRFSVGFLSIMRDSITHRLGHSAVFSAGCGPLVPQVLLPPGDKAQTTEVDLNSVFLPEFPHRTFPEGERHKILGFIAKGSYGPIVRVKDNFKDQVFAVKVLPKSEIIKNKVVDQIKEEVIIQRQLEHPFIHSLLDSWQTQRHLFIMCSHCSHGDLHTYWSLKSQFEEKEVRLFATELGSALGFIHDLGIMHRDVKMENVLVSDRGHLRLSDFGLSRRLKRGGRAFTICGTMQYMGELSAEHPGGSNMFVGRMLGVCWFTPVRQRRDPSCMLSFPLR